MMISTFGLRLGGIKIRTHPKVSISHFQLSNTKEDLASLNCRPRRLLSHTTILHLWVTTDYLTCRLPQWPEAATASCPLLRAPFTLAMACSRRRVRITPLKHCSFLRRRRRLCPAPKPILWTRCRYLCFTRPLCHHLQVSCTSLCPLRNARSVENTIKNGDRKMLFYCFLFFRN